MLIADRVPKHQVMSDKSWW